MSVIGISQQLYLISMFYRSLILVAFLTLVPIFAAQDRPKISLALPWGIASETVQIEYFLTGPFGGYGGFVRAERNKASYDIEPFVDGRPAENIKIIAYLPGCEIAALDLTFSGVPVEQWLDCYPLGSVLFRGQVFPASMTRDQNREIEVTYLAMWGHQFFGIFDGPVTTIRLGTVRPHWDGKFEITLPDLYKQSSLRDGAIQFILRDVKTGNIIAFLKPAQTTPNSPNWLSVRASYPIVQLIAEGQLRQTKP
jgi:hypothetical protein